jgi:hypothetical protein
MTDMLLAIIAVSAAGIAIALARLVGPVTRAARELEQSSRGVTELQPQLERLLQEAEHGMSETRQVVRRAEVITMDLQALARAAKTAQPLLAGLGALATGFRAGTEAFSRWGRAGKHSPNGRGGVR